MRRRRRGDEPVEWDFFSFPVLFAFSLGMFIATLLFYPLGLIFLLVSLTFVSFGFIHIANRFFRERGMNQKRVQEEAEERQRRSVAAQAAATQANAETQRPKRRRRVRRGRGPAEPTN